MLSWQHPVTLFKSTIQRILFQALVYRDGNLVSGSLEALVQHMVPTEEYYPDRAYLFAFLLSARLFIKPHELLGEVCALCEHQQNLNGEGGKVRAHRKYIFDLRTDTKSFPGSWSIHERRVHHRFITGSCILVCSYPLIISPSPIAKYKECKNSFCSFFRGLYYLTPERNKSLPLTLQRIIYH